MSYIISIGGSEITIVRSQGAPNAVLSFLADTPAQISALVTALPGVFALQAEQRASSSLVQSAVELVVQAYKYIAGSWVIHRPYAVVSSVRKHAFAKVRQAGEWK